MTHPFPTRLSSDLANSAAQAPPINPAPTQATASVTGSAVEPCASSIWFVIECHLYFIICRLTNHVIDRSFPSVSSPGSGHQRGGETIHMAAAEKTWFCHHRGLAILFIQQMWEQLSCYVMRSLVVF